MGAPSSQTVTQDVDPAIRGRLLGLYSDASDYLNQTPYQAWQGDRVAGLQPFQQAAQSYLSNALLGQNLGFSSPTTYGPFSYNPGYTGTVWDQRPDGGDDFRNPPSGGDDPQNPPDGGDYQGGDPSDPLDPDQDPINGGEDNPDLPGDWKSGNFVNAMGWPSALAPVPAGPLPTAPSPVPAERTPPTPTTNNSYNPWGGAVQPVGPPTPGTSGGSYGYNGLGLAGYTPMAGYQGMAPYQNAFEGQVVSNAIDDMARAEAMFREGGIYSKGAGTYGGDRMGVQVGEANRNFMDRAGNLAARLRSEGFNTAAGLAQQDANRFLTGNQLQFGNVLQTGEALNNLGFQNQDLAQQYINADIGSYDEARNDPLRRFGLLQGILGGMPVGMSTTTTSRPNTASQIGGGLLGLAGAASGLGWLPFGGGT